jgi:hypothetical protein
MYLLVALAGHARAMLIGVHEISSQGSKASLMRYYVDLTREQKVRLWLNLTKEAHTESYQRT